MLSITLILKNIVGLSCILGVAFVLHAELHPHPQGVVAPGDPLEWTEQAQAVGVDAPQIYEYSREAGPDETLFLVGTNLTESLLVRGSHPDHPAGGKPGARH